MEIKGFFNSFRNIAKESKPPIADKVKELANEANRRLDELKKSDIYSQAYEYWKKSGSKEFGISNGSYQDFQSEYWRIKNFLNAKSSTVEGAKKIVEDMVRVTGMPLGVESMTKTLSKRYFELASKISDYYKMLGNTAKALDYQAIWDSINLAMQHDIDIINEVNDDVDGITQLLGFIGDINDEINTSRGYGDNFEDINRASSAKTKIGFFSGVTSFVKGFIGTLKNVFKRSGKAH